MTAALAPFVAELRSSPGIVRLGSAEAPAITVRVQVLETWDVIRIEASPSESVRAVTGAALERLLPRADQRDFVTKLRGFEVLEENRSLEEVGAIDGSTLLVMRRRRRPVR